MAAGVLLIQEAGGVVTDLEGGDRYMETGSLVAGGPKLHHAMIETIRPHLTENLRYNRA